MSTTTTTAAATATAVAATHGAVSASSEGSGAAAPAARATDSAQAVQCIPLPTPRALREAVPAPASAHETVCAGRETVRRIVRREDPRFLVVVGPCSLHDLEATQEYAERLAALHQRYADRLYIVMRAYFEKPRTSVGWRGLINDPHLDGSCDMIEGLARARQALGLLAALGLPAATELLDLGTPAYYADLISLASIGARTTESQPHRALASGLPMPVGFKNGTDGGIHVAVNAMVSARQSHSQLGFDDDGRACVVRTPGNEQTMLVLRGGSGCIPNYDPESVAAAETGLKNAGFDTPALLVDASHANSSYDPTRQADACRSTLEQRRAGRESLRGVMIESNLVGGKQALSGDPGSLRYGVSITDACLGWADTAALLERLYALAAE